MILNVAIWSVQLRPARNPACSSFSVSSSAALTRSKITLQNILLLVMFSSMMGRQFSQWLRSLFFVSLIGRPNSSISPAPALHSISGCRGPEKPSLTPLPLIASGGILSQPVAFPLFNFFIAFLISTRVMRHVLMCSSSPGSTLGGLGGSPWLRHSFKVLYLLTPRCPQHHACNISHRLTRTLESPTQPS